MKKLKLEISDKVFKKLENEMGLKKLCGELFGLPDEFLLKIIKAVRDDKELLTLSLKK